MYCITCRVPNGSHAAADAVDVRSLAWCNLQPPLLVQRCVMARHQVMKNEGIECLEGELLLVKLQNASCEGLHGKVCRLHLLSGIDRLVAFSWPFVSTRLGSRRHIRRNCLMRNRDGER